MLDVFFLVREISYCRMFRVMEDVVWGCFGSWGSRSFVEVLLWLDF